MRSWTMTDADLPVVALALAVVVEAVHGTPDGAILAGIAQDVPTADADLFFELVDALRWAECTFGPDVLPRAGLRIACRAAGLRPPV
jgi:hypothetical protein